MHVDAAVCAEHNCILHIVVFALPINIGVVSIIQEICKSRRFGRQMWFYQRWAFFTEVDILYKSGHSLQRWSFFTEMVILYRDGHSLQRQAFCTEVGILYRGGHSLRRWALFIQNLAGNSMKWRRRRLVNIPLSFLSRDIIFT